MDRYTFLWIGTFLVMLLYTAISKPDFEGTSASVAIPYFVIAAIAGVIQYFKLLGKE